MQPMFVGWWCLDEAYERDNYWKLVINISETCLSQSFSCRSLGYFLFPSWNSVMQLNWFWYHHMELDVRKTPFNMHEALSRTLGARKLSVHVTTLSGHCHCTSLQFHFYLPTQRCPQLWREVCSGVVSKERLCHTTLCNFPYNFPFNFDGAVWRQERKICLK